MSIQQSRPATGERAWPPPYYVSGATAGGKTAVGVELARQAGGEIVSMDSMALYRGMDVGTAKPGEAERQAVPHHLIDVLDPSEECSLAQYLAMARRAAAEIRARGRQPIFVGGTPLYLKALLRGIFEGPPADWEFRRKLEAMASEQGPEALHEILRRVDPRSAERLGRRDARRAIRALEVFEKTGRPISELQQQFEQARPATECRVFVLDWPRQELYARIERRVEAMFESGLVAEVQTLLAAGRPLSRTARQALGYREVLEHLAGQRDLPETISLVKTRTRQFAKRQLTWFRSLSECRTVKVHGAWDATALAAQIRALAERDSPE